MTESLDAASRPVPARVRPSRLRWALVAGYLVFNVVLPFTYGNDGLLAAETFVTTALLFVIAVLHGRERYGWGHMAVFFLFTFVVSFTFENLSVRTGFPFGRYAYSPTLGVLEVPVVIVFAYFAVGYLSWTVAHVLTEQYARRLRGGRVVVVPVVAAFVMVMWDLTIDPISSTLQELWVWEDPGPYFGVPLSNFAGWFFVVWSFFTAFAVFLARRDRLDARQAAVAATRAYWAEAVAMYGLVGLGSVLSVFYERNDVTLSMALVTVFTMGFATLLAGLALVDPRRGPAGA